MINIPDERFNMCRSPEVQRGIFHGTVVTLERHDASERARKRACE